MKSVPIEILKLLARVRNVSYQIFLAGFLVAGITTIVALRDNNEQMLNLRNQVYAADKSNGNVNAALNNLRNYVYAHMNTDLSSSSNGIKPPIQLKYTYERLESAAQQSANNAGLYTAAENYCQAAVPASVSISGRGRIACIEAYVTSHGGKAAAAIPTALYQFDFISPTWSPDLAGWSLLATALFAMLFIISLATYWLRRY